MTEFTLLQPPEEISLEDTDKLPHQWNASFFSRRHGYSLLYDEGDISFTLEYYGVFPMGLDIELFEQEERVLAGECTIVYRHAFGGNPWSPSVEQKRIGFQPSYHAAKPLIVREQCDESPIGLLVDYVSNHRVVFYTGAGLSEASGVAGMTAFMDEMGIDTKKPIDDFIKRLLSTPKVLTETFASFCHSAFHGEPTVGHRALKEIALRTNSQIVTENFDHLHERSGIKALRTEDIDLTAEIDPSSFAELDAFCCICLSYDDRGLLAWYKKHNPKGKLIALNLRQPSYIGAKDMFIRGNVHELLRELNEAL